MRPAQDRWTLPAEWEHHEATWLAWPQNTSDWPGKFTPIPWVYAEIVRAIAPGEQVRILVGDARGEARARRVLERAAVETDSVSFFKCRTDRGWMRDTGPIFVRPGSNRSLSIARFRFNGWAKYNNWKRDARIPDIVSRKLGVPLFESRKEGRPVVLEGGSIDVNGSGTILTTEECLLDDRVQVRNPGFSRTDYEEVFASTLGAGNTIWLGKGIAGDDTHGHVDDLCRFVDRSTMVLATEDDPSDANYDVLKENRERLEGARLEDGTKPQVVLLPMPAPVVFDGQRLPASYANFYISNAAVLVPTFNDPNDRRALEILADLFPERTVVGIHAVDLVWGLGTIHCLTQQQPAMKHD